MRNRCRMGFHWTHKLHQEYDFSNKLIRDPLRRNAHVPQYKRETICSVNRAAKSQSVASIKVQSTVNCLRNHVIWRLANWRVRTLTNATVSANECSPCKCSTTCR